MGLPVPGGRTAVRGTRRAGATRRPGGGGRPGPARTRSTTTLARHTEARREIDRAADGSRAARPPRRAIDHARRRRVAAARIRRVRPCRYRRRGQAARRAADGVVGAGARTPRRGRRNARPPSSEPGLRRSTASTWPPTWRPGWSSATSRWSPVAPTASTARRTARRWPADGITVAVLAGGLDIPYPAGHSALLHRIGQHGLLFTEYPPGVRPARHRFLTRNRLVAAVAGAAVVVEAGLRSGAANTAAWARALGRVVAAVPGPVTSSASAGCHALLRNGAELVTRADDVVELVGRIGELAPEEPRPDHGARRAERGRASGVRGVARPRRRHGRRDRGRVGAGARTGAGPAGDARGRRVGRAPRRAVAHRPRRRRPALRSTARLV